MMNSLSTHTHLMSYLEAVDSFVDRTIQQTQLPPEQVELLLPRKKTKQSGATRVLAHPLAPFYFAVRAHGVPLGVDAEAIGAGFLLFHHALCLIDDIQDDELTGSYADMSGAVAVNSGLTLFFLALDTLWAAERQTPTASAWNLHSSLRFNALRLSRGQHRDLTGRGQLRTPATTLEIATEKSAICALLMEYAAIYAAVTPSRLSIGLEPYRVIGDALAQIQQIIDDVAELFDLSESQDLRTGTWNVPLTIFLDTVPLEDRAQWATRLRETDQHDVCRLLYDTKAMHRVAATIEAARICIHQTFAELPCGGPYLAMLLAWLDDLVAIIYTPRVLHLCVDIDTVDNTGLHPADRTLFEQLRAAYRTAQEAQKTVQTNSAQHKRSYPYTASMAGRVTHTGVHGYECAPPPAR
jgi:geranylgeranyl pyrophosphate synthase